MTTYETNSIWGIEPRITDVQSKRDMDCKCSRCNERKTKDIFIYVWNDDVNFKYCEECSSNRFECDYKFQTVRNELAIIKLQEELEYETHLLEANFYKNKKDGDLDGTEKDCKERIESYKKAIDELAR